MILVIFAVLSFGYLLYNMVELENLNNLNHGHMNEYKWRIVEITHKDGTKAYTLQVKFTISWYNYAEGFDSFGLCEAYYIGLLQEDKNEQIKKMNKKIIDKKIINLKQRDKNE